ncbi:hypothetical protein [Methyloterricola oryzae]|uniref:hypothetical protein n=1 Tax=Methyloterricola oryzae TaxID=1495050 RepID=UPI0005EB4ACF|nr:hypothetical protein [Methyloterricola oryzae]
MKVIAWKTPIHVSKVYQFQLNSPDRPEPIDWYQIPGEHKMRKFFADKKDDVFTWHKDIDEIDFAGSKNGGVIFIRKKRVVPGVPRISYAIKLVEAPERVLFAEFVLGQIAKAKIPKSLVVELDWDSLGNDLPAKLEQKYCGKNKPFDRTRFFADLNGLDVSARLLHFIFCDGLLKQETKDELRLYQYITDFRNKFTSSQSKPRYLIIMKSLKARDEEFLPFDYEVRPFDKPEVKITYSYRLDNGEDLIDVLKSVRGSDKITLGGVDVANHISTAFPDYRENKKLLKAISQVLISKQILSNEKLMKKAGRVLAVDTALGNSDRFEGTELAANIGNVFFFKKKYTNRLGLNKDDNPVGVIDNDAFFPLLKRFGNLDKYLAFLLENGWSDIDAANDPENLSAAGIKLSNLKSLFSQFEEHIAMALAVALMSPSQRESKMVPEIWSDDGKLFGHPGKYKTFESPWVRAKRQGLQEIKHVTRDNILALLSDDWKQTIAWMREGFVEGIADLLKFSELRYKSVWAHLVGLYGINGCQSDFKSFLVRLEYMRHVDCSGKSFGFITKNGPADHNAVVLELKNQLQKRTVPIPALVEALSFGVDTNLIDAHERDWIEQSFLDIDASDQTKVLTRYSADQVKDKKLKNRIMAINLALAINFAKHMEAYVDVDVSDPQSQATKKNEDVTKRFNVKKCDFTKSKYPKVKTDPYDALGDVVAMIPEPRRSDFKKFIILI